MIKHVKKPLFIIGLLIPILIGGYAIYILSPNKLRVNSECKSKTVDVDFEEKIKSNFISGMSLFVDDSLALEYYISDEFEDKNKLFGHVIVFDRHESGYLEHVFSINTDNKNVISYVRTDTTKSKK